ncbi:MAG: precorrin-6A/cobalt-precorrin-6A reductase [Rhodobacteraceae bacterium]|nr:precorrin-6A/cobalt-precorrin-6A reductase [Paracoccaceae bacterium]
MKLALSGGSREANLLEKELFAVGIKIDPSGAIAVVAAHPFDTDIWECAALSMAGKPHIGLLRPAWRATAEDEWQSAASAEEAAALLAKQGVKRALLAVGNSRLAPFYRLPDIELCVRSRNAPHPPAPPRGRIRTMRGPFDIAGEIEELRDQGIDMIVAHNAGGPGGWPKLGAARKLGIPVLLISRPKLPDMEMVETVDEALAWAKRHMGLDD